MTITMDDTQITTLEQIQKVLESGPGLVLKGMRREDCYAWIEAVLRRFDYFNLRRKAKGQVKAYLQRLSGLSHAQVTRLVTRNLLEGEIKPGYARRTRFATKYTRGDKELLAQTDNAHRRLSGPATRKILQRQYAVYSDKRFERLSGISSAHIYNLRSSRAYRQRAQTVAKTHSVCVSIGIRRKPEPQGRPGYIRVDTVHQGDLNGKKGVYHINLVDAVTQWEIVLCVEAISEAHLWPILEIALMMFPFMIVNFHSDNGGEFINGLVAKMLNKLLIEQTKSRANRTNDNALVEGKNGSVIRKHMGHWHIPGEHAAKIQRFYKAHFKRVSELPPSLRLRDDDGRRERAAAQEVRDLPDPLRTPPDDPGGHGRQGGQGVPARRRHTRGARQDRRQADRQRGCRGDAGGPRPAFQED